MISPVAARRAVVVMVAVVLGAVACGLPEDAQPTEIPRSRLPAALAPSTSSGGVPDPSGRQVVYLVRAVGQQEQLVPVSVSLPGDPIVRATDEASALVQRLVLDPPVSADSELVTAIPAGTPAPRTSADGDVLVVDLPALGSIEGVRQRQAAAQVVFTATSVPGVAGVRFLADGKTVSVPVDGRAAEPGEVLTRANYPSLRS